MECGGATGGDLRNKRRRWGDMAGMRIIPLCLFFSSFLAAQQHEFGFLLGGLLANARGTVRLTSGTAYQFNYGYRLAGGDKPVALYGEVHFLANPQRIVGSGVVTATRDVATIYLTPGLRLKFFPSRRVSPYATAGAGWALYEQSRNQLNGEPNPAPRTVNKGTFMYGAGVDFNVVRHFALRGEIRDFYSGNPALNIPGLRGGQHNVVVSGGFVLLLR
jgi:opacity protein-like surface antigen